MYEVDPVSVLPVVKMRPLSCGVVARPEDDFGLPPNPRAPADTAVRRRWTGVLRDRG
jgi:hypothetical protein